VLPVKRFVLTPLCAAALLSSGCATNPYGSGPGAGQRAMIGAGVGAAVGALAGPAIGMDRFGGAGLGAIAGGAAGALIKGPIIHQRQYYKDTRGYCYYIDRNGQPQYEPAVKC
jgi:hypothetical protein